MTTFSGDVFFRQNEMCWRSAGFCVNSFMCYRKHGNSFQLVAKTWRRPSSPFEHGVFLVVFPFWTEGIKRIPQWPSFEESFWDTEMLSITGYSWHIFGIDITDSYFEYCERNKHFTSGTSSYLECELFPFLNGIYDNESYKKAMISINRHSRIFEEIILLETSKSGNLNPVREWLEIVKNIDAESVEPVAKSIYTFKDAEFFKKWNWNSFEEALEDAEAVIKKTHKLFYGKLIQAVDTNQFDWVYDFYIEAQKKAIVFFKKYFNLEFELEEKG